MVFISFKQLNGPPFTLNVRPTATIGEIKETIAAASGTIPDKIRMVFAGACLEDDATAQDLGLSNETAIMAVAAGVKLRAPDDVDAIPTPITTSLPESPASRPLPSPTGDNVTVTIKRLDGSEFDLSLSITDIIKDVKTRLEEATGIPAPAQAIVFKGVMLPDHVSVRDCGLRDGALVHLVRRNVNIIDTYRKDELRINCRFCHVAGAPVVPRALCPRCGSEAVMITVGTLEPGEFRWIDLLRVRIACMSCGDPATARNPANIGFLCMAKVDGKRCVSRQLFTPDPPDAIVKTVPSHTVLSSSAVAGVPAGDVRTGVVRLGVPPRKLQFVLQGNHPDPEKHLQDTLNELFGYAHAAGVGDRKAAVK